ncbi:hypothetical protein SUGI_0003280 [Cryptomeria japonica]|nr:hypothetical protein SUGI_0003280 [Cryptomeria japonica]
MEALKEGSGNDEGQKASEVEAKGYKSDKAEAVHVDLDEIPQNSASQGGSKQSFRDAHSSEVIKGVHSGHDQTSLVDPLCFVPDGELDAGTETNINLNHQLFYHFLGTEQSEDILCWKDPENPEWLVGADVSEDGKYILLYITEGCDPVNRIYYCDLDTLPQGIESFKGKKEMLPFQKLIDNFEAEYALVANDDTEFTFRTNKNAPRYKLVRVDLRYPESWSDVVPESDKDVLESAGTSDPYVVMQIGDCVVKSKTVWATKEPHWNESFRINVKDPSTKYLQIVVWDANLVTPHKRMGNVGIKLEPLCDGNKHEIQVELEGIGGGGLIYLKINYKDFEEINAEKSGWKIPLLSDIQLAKGLESALKTVFGTENVKVRDFVLSSFGKIEPLLDIGKFEKSQNLEGNLQNTQSFESMPTESFLNGKTEIHNEYGIETGDTFLQSVGDAGFSDQNESSKGKSSPGNKGTMKLTDSSISSEFDFWKNLSDNINQAVERAGINKVGFPSIENVRWSGNEIIKNLGLQSQTQADE